MKTYYMNGEIQCIDTYRKGAKINRKAYYGEGKLKFNQNYSE